MNPARITVHRPVLTTMVTLIVVLLGLSALQRIPVDLLPDVTYPVLTVTANYSGAGPEEIEQLVTRPIEQAAAALTGAQRIDSTSSEGTSRVRIQFAWGTDLNEAVDDLRDRLARIQNQLPADADRPLVRRFDTQAAPILLLGIGSPLDPVQLRLLIEQRISPRLERIPGVAAVDIRGGMQREIRIEVYPDRLLALNIGIDTLRAALRDANITSPGGVIREGQVEYRLRTPAQFEHLDTLAQTVVHGSGDEGVALFQVANVVDTFQRETQRFRVDGEPGLMLAVRKLTDANTIAVAEAVHAEIRQVNRDFPQVVLFAATDQSVYIAKSIENLGRAILYGSSLAVLVLLVFLRHLRFTLVAAVAIPIAVIATFGLVYFGGLTLNVMTLGGLALGVGLMVDNAIVVIESIARQREENPSDGTAMAAIIGTERVQSAIIASTLTTLAIFLPLFFAEELAGQLFKPLAAVVAFALAVSLLVALTLVPMLMARPWIVSGLQSTEHRSRLERGYQRLLEPTVRHPLWVVVASLSLFFLAAVGLRDIGSEFLPATDEGEVRVWVSMQPGTHLGVLDAVLRDMEAEVRAVVPEARHIISSIGSSAFSTRSSASADIRITLGARQERTRSSEEIASALRHALGQKPGISVRVRASGGLFFRGFGRADEDERLTIEVRGFDRSRMREVATVFATALETVNGVTDVRLGQEGGSPEYATRVDRMRAADLGVDVRSIAETLETAMSGTQAGVFRAAGTETRLWIQLQDADQLTMDALLALTVSGREDARIPLRTLVEFIPILGPERIQRREQGRILNLQVNVSGRPLGDIAAEVRQTLATIPLPEEIDYIVTGDIEEQEAAFSELMLGTVLAILLVYMVLASLYESFRNPLIVMFSVPLAGIGVVFSLLLTGTTLNVQSLIGVMLLVGIVVNNAILLVDRMTWWHRNEGLAVREAVLAAAKQRLRPVLMTTLTTVLALLPLAIGGGEGGEAQAPMARVVIGGLLSSTLITLFLIPALYLLFHPERRWSPR